MKKIIYSTIMASLLSFVGCQQELVNDNITHDGGEKVILTANIQGSTDTKVSLTPATDENGNPIVKAEWEESGEKFKVYGLDEEGGPNGNSPTWFTQIDGTNQFEGTLPVSATGNYYAVYGDDLESKNLPFQYELDEQDGTIYQRNEYYSTVLMGVEFSSSSPSLTFEHITAILKPTFKVEGNAINNTITQIVMSGVVVPTTALPGLEEITIAPTSPATTLADDIYIHLPIVEPYTNHEFTFAVKAGGKSYTASLTIPEGKFIEAGNLYTADIKLTEKLELRYVDSENTFYVSGPAGLMALNKWMTKTNEDSHNEFTNLKFPGYESLIGDSNYMKKDYCKRLSRNITLETDITLPLRTNDGTEITFTDGVPSGSNWTPIGGSQNYKDEHYVGTFDGNGKTIKNLTIYNDKYTLGLINALGADGVVKNLTLEDVTLKSKAAGSVDIGGIAATVNGKVSNCTVKGKFSHTYCNMGGIAGTNYGTIENCTNYSEISGISTTVPSHTCNIGGIVGMVYTMGKIMNCTNSGKLNNYSTGNLGGIAGISKGGRIENCTTTENCVVTGNITLVNSDKYGIGGIVGKARTENNNSPIVIMNCTNNAKVHTDITEKAFPTGGIVGIADAYCQDLTIENCTNNGSITHENYHNDVGGIVGSAYASSNNYGDYFAIIKGCINYGDISYYGTSYTENFVGGIAGQLQSRMYCFGCGNIGTITFALVQADRLGCVGGIAGNVSNETCEVRGCWTKDVLEYDQSAPVTENKDGFGHLSSSPKSKDCYIAVSGDETSQIATINDNIAKMNNTIWNTPIKGTQTKYYWISGINGDWPTLTTTYPMNPS